MNNSQLKFDLMNLNFRDPRKDAATAEAARREIERLEEKVAELDQHISDEAELKHWKDWR